MNPNLEKLEPYPFTKLRQLFSDLQPPVNSRAISLGMGEPQHASPGFVLDEIAANLQRLSNYPATIGLPELRESIAAWLQRRFDLPHVNPGTQVLPVNGTREALFSFAQAVVSPDASASVMCPNPSYQIYEGAALLAGARPHFINCTAESGFLPDFKSVTEEQWQQCR